MKSELHEEVGSQIANYWPTRGLRADGGARRLRSAAGRALEALHARLQRRDLQGFRTSPGEGASRKENVPDSGVGMHGLTDLVEFRMTHYIPRIFSSMHTIVSFPGFLLSSMKTERLLID